MELDLTVNSPGEIRSCLVAAFDSIQDERHQARLPLQVAPLDWPFLRQALKSRKWPPGSKSALLQLFAGLIPTRSWAYEKGHAIDPRCPCGLIDDPPHRLQGCSHTQVAANSITPEALQRSLARLPRPYASRKALKVTINGEDTDIADFQWDTSRPLYSDGSCKYVDDPDLAIAASAVFQVTADGGTKAASMSVPEGHPCSAVCAEHMALLMVEAFTPPGQQVSLVVDCQALVQGFEATTAQRASYRNKFAGYWQVAHQVIRDIHKVKSHMTRAQAESASQVEWWHGNSTVDWLANVALPQYPQVELDDFFRDAKVQKSTLRQVCDHLSQVENMAPMARLLKENPRTKAAKEQAKARRRHCWTWQGSRRLCTLCGIAPRTQDVGTLRRPCAGSIPGYEVIHGTHRMRITGIVASGAALVFCKQCGSYGQSRFANLRLPCQGRPSAATRTMHKRLLRGQHPLTQVSLLPHVAWRPDQVSKVGPPTDPVPLPHAPGPPQQVGTHRSGVLTGQLEVLAGYEQGLAHAVQTDQDSSDEDVFAHGFDLAEP
jgi:hypothetical protein